jgi:hypothetical protein
MSAAEGYDSQSELDRKSTETLDWLIVSLDQGRVTEDQFSTAIDALFMALSGLVDRQFIEIVTEAQSQCGSGRRLMKRMFHHPSEAKIIVFSWSPGDYVVSTTESKFGVAAGLKRTEFNSPKDAFWAFSTGGERLRKNGWVEL